MTTSNSATKSLKTNAASFTCGSSKIAKPKGKIA
jgi:hypothetical protein